MVLILVRSLIGDLLLPGCREGLRDQARENLEGFGIERHLRRCGWSGKLEKRQSQLHGSSPLQSRSQAAGSGRG